MSQARAKARTTNKEPLCPSVCSVSFVVVLPRTASGVADYFTLTFVVALDEPSTGLSPNYERRTPHGDAVGLDPMECLAWGGEAGIHENTLHVSSPRFDACAHR